MTSHIGIPRKYPFIDNVSLKYVMMMMQFSSR